MHKRPRRRVVRYVQRHPYPSWPATRYAVLECGHEEHVGPNRSPQIMACHECDNEARKSVA